MSKSNCRQNRLVKSSQLTVPIETGKNAARERSRVRSLRLAFQQLQQSIPTIPADTKLSKLDVLILATDYISHLTNLLNESESTQSTSTENSTNLIECKETMNEKILHPIKKWPMRSRLYAKPESNNLTTTINKTSTLTTQATCSTINDYIDCSSDYNCYLFDKIDPFKCDDWNGIDLNMFYEDFNSLTSFPN
ncbi:transcription factor 23-like, partial [Panonychus citri]|uniref:transcription factor 23-like n=1 Tax=Panonychus citri TaxID=50023 RepID=UPI0023075032